MIGVFGSLVFLSLISVVYCLISSNTYMISILPFSFLFFICIFYKVFFRIFDSFVFKLFLIQALFRYLFLPVAFSHGYHFNYESTLVFAIFVMVAECFLIFLVFWVFSIRKKKTVCFNNKEIKLIDNHFKFLLILLILLIYVYFSGATSNISFIWNFSDFVDAKLTDNIDLQTNNLGMIVFSTLKIFFSIFLLSYIYKINYISYSLKKYLYLIVILLSCLFVTGLSRFSLILNVMVILGFLPFLLNKREVAKIYLLSMPLIFSVFLIISISKFSRYENESNFLSLIDYHSINAYFSGFSNISIGINSYQSINLSDGFFYLINDVFQNIPYLSNFTVNEYKTNLVFNSYFYNHNLYADQIVPLSISGLFHFGYIGLFFYSPFFIIIALFMEKLCYRVKYIGYKYIFMYLCIIFSLVFMLNVGSFYATLFRTIFFMLIPLFLLQALTKFRVGS